MPAQGLRSVRIHAYMPVVDTVLGSFQEVAQLENFTYCKDTEHYYSENWGPPSPPLSPQSPARDVQLEGDMLVIRDGFLSSQLQAASEA